MKSSVINSGNSGGGNNSQQQHPQTAPQGSVNIDGNNNPQQGQNARSPFFDFEMDDPRDFFTNPALRSRLSRMRNPWGSMGFAAQQRKRPNQGPEEEDSGFVEDPHESFFSKFDPHWGDSSQWPRSTLRKRHPADFGGHSDFFDHLPSEFRQYIPDDFGFQHPHTTTMPPAQRQAAPHQATPQHHTQHTAERPRFCDAAMQTDDEPPTPQEETTQTPSVGVSAPLKQHGMRNTVDLGQKSPPEERAERAKSAPPEAETDETGAVQTEPTSLQPPASPTSNVRHIPIIVEHTNKGQAPPQPPKRAVSQKKFVLKPQGVSATAGTSTQTPVVEHEETLQEPPPASQPEAPPTPSAESIAKIQQIQKEVLELMFRVEAFQGNSRADKEYLFLDEMLTRNLLKLDTIDTQGNESIRLARREAIKCIQASLSVLEAKADGSKVKPEVANEPTAEGPTETPVETPIVARDVPEPPSESTEVDKSKIPIPLPPIEPKQVEETSKSEEENEKQPEPEQNKDDTKVKKKKVIVKKVSKKDNTENESTAAAQNDNEQT
ncbi:hypothetical protein DMENIID0001_092080 [Sergentomyia squamirostris]